MTLKIEGLDKVIKKVNAQTLSSDELKVVEIMQYAIAWRATADASVSLTYQLKNKGLQKQNGDNSETVELSETTFMYDVYLQKAIYFEAELKKYLLNNKDLYPVFTDKLNKDNGILGCDGDDNYNGGVGLFII